MAVLHSTETWKSIPKYSGYEVSDLGRVRSYFAWGTRTKKLINSSRILSQAKYGGGRLFVKLAKPEGGKRLVNVATLVLEAFVGVKPASANGVRHLNDIPSDNRLCNLCWGSRKENAKDAVRNGRQVRGERHGCSRLCVEDVLKIRKMLAAGMSQGRTAAIMGIGQAQVSRIKDRINWGHIP